MIKIFNFKTRLAVAFFATAIAWGCSKKEGKKNRYEYDVKQAALQNLSPQERKPYDSLYAAMSISEIPKGSNIRNAAEWEEMDGIIVSWKQFHNVEREIIRNAQKEGKVYVVCQDSVPVINYLNAYNIPLTNVHFMLNKSDRPWTRDLGGNNVYLNEVDSLVFVDWEYNRKRPNDDVLALYLGKEMGVPVYSMVGKKYDLVGTGGNFMSDGFGTGFSSKIVELENPRRKPAEVDDLMKKFMGINRYVKMDVLPYDGIHHIDMHMKLLDEETLLVSQYPKGVADGPQIEKNLKFVLDNFKTVYGTPYKIVRIPAPPHEDINLDNAGMPKNPKDMPTKSKIEPEVKRWEGAYRGQQPEDSKKVPSYRTYTNSLILNKTVMVPMFEHPEYDTVALRIYKKAMPGYNVVGYDCRNSIDGGGAIHCLTHEIAVADPLLISHQQFASQPKLGSDLKVDAVIKHRSGIATARIYYKTQKDKAFQSVPMAQSNAQKGIWTGKIPTQPDGTVLQYYLWAKAKSGKEQARPMPAPTGYWTYKINAKRPENTPEVAIVKYKPAS